MGAVHFLHQGHGYNLLAGISCSGLSFPCPDCIGPISEKLHSLGRGINGCREKGCQEHDTTRMHRTVGQVAVCAKASIIQHLAICTARTLGAS
jgi:hypothetical protein